MMRADTDDTWVFNGSKIRCLGFLKREFGSFHSYLELALVGGVLLVTLVVHNDLNWGFSEIRKLSG
jgi:hypothetical protein